MRSTLSSARISLGVEIVHFLAITMPFPIFIA
jgi:hypothetical protein